jgi:hypothetical protein
MPNRVELDIQGTTYVFPINPVEYDPQESDQHTLSATVDGGAVRFVPFFDSRKRVMRWRDIPNRAPYNTLIPNLRSSVGISGVRINHRDLTIFGDKNVWKTIRVESVEYRYLAGSGPGTAIGNLRYNIDFVFSYVPLVP